MIDYPFIYYTSTCKSILQILEWFYLMEAFFVLARLMNMFVIALHIVTNNHPGARARMQSLAVAETMVFKIIELQWTHFTLSIIIPIIS